VSEIDGGELLIRMLERAGIREVFTLHDGHLDCVFMAARDHGIRVIDTRHEQAAAHAADGWARTTGKPGVALVAAGPGLTDAVTGVANAFVDAVPMLVISGGAPLCDAEMLQLQSGFDQVALMAPITKWSHRITHTERIPDLVAQALRIATTGRPGPVYLEIPVDVIYARVDEQRAFFPERIGPDSAPAPTNEAVQTAIEWLETAERPVIVAGGGAWFSGGAAELRAFAERTKIPVFSNGKAHGVLPADHPLCGRSVFNLAILNSMGAGKPDLALVLGARMGMFVGGRSGVMIPKTARLIQVDIEAEEIGRNRDVGLGIVADCRETLRALDAAAADRKWPERSEWVAAARQAAQAHRAMFGEALASEKAPIHPYAMVDAIVQTVDRNAIVVADGGETSVWTEMACQVYEAGHWLSHGYLACLGAGMPFAIAAQLAHPDQRVVCVVGDGSVGLNFAEFDTMVRHGLPIVVVVNNDQQWGMSAHGQDIIYGPGRRVATDLAATRYDLAAAAFGCHPEHVVEPAELIPALERAFASGRPACVNVMTDPSVISPITTALVQGAAAQGMAGDGKQTSYLP
jgi:acetolactate synthase-1/2/3 large subunit